MIVATGSRLKTERAVLASNILFRSSLLMSSKQQKSHTAISLKAKQFGARTSALPGAGSPKDGVYGFFLTAGTGAWIVPHIMEEMGWQITVAMFVVIGLMTFISSHYWSRMFAKVGSATSVAQFGPSSGKCSTRYRT